MLFYDLFELATFKQRWEAGSAAAAAEEEAAWAAADAAVAALEPQLGPPEAFVR